MTTLAFTPGRHAGRWTSPLRRVQGLAAAAAPMVPVILARAAVVAGIGVLAGAGWGLVVAGLLVAAWPRRAAR